MRTRRTVLSAAVFLSATPALSFFTSARAASAGPTSQLIKAARDALQQHGDRVTHTDVIGIADFTLPSRQPRFHILNLADGSSEAYLVAHGRGSDPAHTGWLERFSNEFGSEATSKGSYVTGSTYMGHHGLSQRLLGLDPQNSNAEKREIVMHSAWYVSSDLAHQAGVLGRSEGCLAFAEADYHGILSRMGEGRFIYAGKA